MKPDRIPAIMLLPFIGVPFHLPTAATAHVRWFVEDGNAAPSVPNTPSDPAVWTWALIAMALVTTAVVLDTKLPAFAVPDTKANG